jgi:hypothetical protein
MVFEGTMPCLPMPCFAALYENLLKVEKERGIVPDPKLAELMDRIAKDGKGDNIFVDLM